MLFLNSPHPALANIDAFLFKVFIIQLAFYTLYYAYLKTYIMMQPRGNGSQHTYKQYGKSIKTKGKKQKCKIYLYIFKNISRVTRFPL